MAGLIYQVVWSRMLTLVLGVGIFAVTAVICTYMAGLALGSWLVGRYGERWRDELLTYGVFEAAIGIYAAATPWLLATIQPAYVWAFRNLDPSALNVFRILLSSLMLLLPTLLMGGTLPLLSRAIQTANLRPARGVGALYAVNTLGAVVGCLLAGFVLLAELGIRGSLYVTAALNLGIALAAFAVSRGSSTGAEIPQQQTFPVADRASDERLVLGLFFVAGFAALGYVVLWTRALLVYLKSSTYAFSVMLGVYLTGVALGSLAASGIAGRSPRPLLWPTASAAT
jgi:spermidine synthase